MKRQEEAVQLFMNGFRCSQAVLEVFAAEAGLEIDMARRISIGLAGGAGCSGECGAVEAAYLVNGLRFGFSHPGDSEQFRVAIGKNAEFADRFRKLHGSLDCLDLIGVDPFSEEGLQTFQEKELKSTICAHLVSDAVMILEEIGTTPGSSRT